MNKSILIVGTGALATLFAARLSAAGVKVTMLGTWREGLTALQKDGARLDDRGGQPVQATNDPMSATSVEYGGSVNNRSTLFGCSPLMNSSASC